MEFANYIDIGIIVIVLLLGLRGLKNGLVHEIMSMVGVILGIYLASKYCVELSKYLKLAGLELQNETILWSLAFIIIFSFIWIGFLVVGTVIARFIVAMPELAIINYFGGYIFSALKYFVILCVLVYAFSQIGFLKAPIKDFTKDTTSYPIMYEVAEKIMSLETIQEIQGQYEEQAQKVKKDVDKNIEKTKKNITRSLQKSIQ
ncbi:CvpA family protein [Helicobacter sp. MIT 14-3879]|uniref:CvpA family protein n=1 Tax=Helicobacter sp. MIT 14-3879 TaxID=2040649 RepID=UPI000E1E5207|nr:CvpA family protein [Helicobacter sp. MIT 14-3879]RDU61236.1 CvpA family protein [Helicobacter sp. MIT 14-3879]